MVTTRHLFPILFFSLSERKAKTTELPQGQLSLIPFHFDQIIWTHVSVANSRYFPISILIIISEEEISLAFKNIR